MKMQAVKQPAFHAQVPWRTITAPRTPNGDRWVPPLRFGLSCYYRFTNQRCYTQCNSWKVDQLAQGVDSPLRDAMQRSAIDTLRLQMSQDPSTIQCMARAAVRGFGAGGRFYLNSLLRVCPKGVVGAILFSALAIVTCPVWLMTMAATALAAAGWQPVALAKNRHHDAAILEGLELGLQVYERASSVAYEQVFNFDNDHRGCGSPALVDLCNELQKTLL